MSSGSTIATAIKTGPTVLINSLHGLTKVRTEWSLVTLAYHLKRVLNLVSFEKLMAAVA